MKRRKLYKITHATFFSFTDGSTAAPSKDQKSKWLHCITCKSPFSSAWDLMVHVQTAHMLNIYLLADSTKLVSSV